MQQNKSGCFFLNTVYRICCSSQLIFVSNLKSLSLHSKLSLQQNIMGINNKAKKKAKINITTEEFHKMLQVFTIALFLYAGNVRMPKISKKVILNP